MKSGLRVALLTLASLLALPGISLKDAWSHAERPSFFPDNRMTARPAYRPLLDPSSGNPTPQANRLVVCKKPGDEGVAKGQDSASLIAGIVSPGLRKANETLLAECRFQHLQAAVDAVTKRGTTIYILPGIYREQPSIRALEQNFGAKDIRDRDFCKAVVARGTGELSYKEQFLCPFIQNTVAIFGDPDFTDDNCGTKRDGKCEGNPKTLACDPAKSACQYYDLQIEGTGQKITDVIFSGDFLTKSGDPSDGAFRYLNGIRADRTDGIYFRNFTTQIFEFNAVYVIEADGYVFDRLLSRWVDEYSFLSFASDRGLYDFTEGYNVADSAQYPGSGADIYPDKQHGNADLRKRQATEIRNSKGHHGALGYSGTAGNAPWVHNNEFYRNQTGMATESIFGGHPGMPQDHALFEKNRIYSNNKDYYRFVAADGPCIVKSPRDRGVVPKEVAYFDKLPADHQEAIMDRTIVCPPIPFPTGTGVLIGGGNYNVVENNEIFDHWRQGVWLISAPTLVHLVNEPYAPRPLPKDLIKILPAPVAGNVDTANAIAGALQLAIETGSAPLLFQQPAYTAHYNRFLNNTMGIGKFGSKTFRQPNGVDFWWDGSGKGNCFVGNKGPGGSAATISTDPAKPAGTAMSDCLDGDSTNLIDQTTTAYPPRILPFVPCLAYSRTDPGSKDFCPFFTPLSPPAGRQSENAITSLSPSDGSLVVDGRAQIAYFVLHNNSGFDHKLQSAVIRVSGEIAKLADTFMEVNGVKSGKPTINGDLATFVFASPVTLERSATTLVEALMVVPVKAATARLPEGSLLYAGMGGFAGIFLVMGGLLRRRWAVLLAVLAMGLAACMGSDEPTGPTSTPPITTQPAGVVEQPITPPVRKIELMELKFTSDSKEAVYPGLPLTISKAF